MPLVRRRSILGVETIVPSCSRDPLLAAIPQLPGGQEEQRFPQVDGSKGHFPNCRRTIVRLAELELFPLLLMDSL